MPKIIKMSLILNIETSTPVCSASLARNGEIVGIQESFDEKSHAALLSVFIDSLLTENKVKPEDIEAVSVSEGPGSYTGLRIGVSVAKGFCYAKNIPLIAVNTLQAMAIMAGRQINDRDVLLCPMIDARRMEVYSALFDSQGTEIRGTMAQIIDESTFTQELAKNKIMFFGNGSDKCKEKITHPNAIFLNGIYPSAKYMAPLSQKAFNSKDFKDVAYFEPFYLKDFVATIPKNKLF